MDLCTILVLPLLSQSLDWLSFHIPCSNHMPWLNVANDIIPSATERYQLATKKTPTPPSPCVLTLQYPVTLLEEK